MNLAGKVRQFFEKKIKIDLSNAFKVNPSQLDDGHKTGASLHGCFGSLHDVQRIRCVASPHVSLQFCLGFK